MIESLRDNLFWQFGSTGNSTGPHAHFEVMINGENVDPMKYFERKWLNLVLIFTDNEQLNQDINKKIKDSRIVYYADYILEEKEADTLIISVQNNKYNFKDFMFKVRDKNIRVILLLENEEQKELEDALLLGIYDIIFDPFSLEDLCKKINTPSLFYNVSKYIKNIIELENI